MGSTGGPLTSFILDAFIYGSLVGLVVAFFSVATHGR